MPQTTTKQAQQLQVDDALVMHFAGVRGDLVMRVHSLSTRTFAYDDVVIDVGLVSPGFDYYTVFHPKDTVMVTDLNLVGATL